MSQTGAFATILDCVLVTTPPLLPGGLIRTGWRQSGKELAPSSRGSIALPPLQGNPAPKVNVP